MSILTSPIFYYIEKITTTNYILNFKEPTQENIELTALINLGTYSLTGLMNEVVRALNSYGQNKYTGAINRETREVTISADNEFSLLTTSGAASDVSVLPVIGFIGADHVGNSSYIGAAAGESYRPQFPLQEFVGSDKNKTGISPSLNESASGEVEFVTFGQKRMVKFNMKYITDQAFTQGGALTNLSSVNDTINLMEALTDKIPVEFMKSVDDKNSYETLLLEKTRGSSKGIGYELKELYGQNLIGYYETGKMEFRVI